MGGVSSTSSGIEGNEGQYYIDIISGQNSKSTKNNDNDSSKR